jgi:phosphatidylglycerophosphatase A
MSHKLKYLIGSGFTNGILLPKAPGTEGSLVATILGGLAWYYFGPIGTTVLFLASILAGFWSAPWYISSYGDDPGSFVMDEWAGQFLALHIVWFLPDNVELFMSVTLIFSSFVLFRFFDILKPLGIKRLETLPGATGVMSDDILAGFYTFLTLFFVIFTVL